MDGWVEHSEQLRQSTLPGVAESGVPRHALAYLEAVRRYYQPGVTRLPRNADIAACHVPKLLPRTWDRRKTLLRGRKLGDRDWIEVWPPPPDWHPSWEPRPQSTAQPDGSDGLVHQIYDEIYDPTNGKLIEKRLLRTIGHLGALAAMYFYSLLDMSDGRLDGSFTLARYSRQALLSILDWSCHKLS